MQKNNKAIINIFKPNNIFRIFPRQVSSIFGAGIKTNKQSKTMKTVRYLSNLEFARGQDPPIIIYAGGEWEVKKGQLGDIGQLYHIAKENEGALYYLEHRFYGKSLPKPDYSTENLKFLTSDQAQKDLLGFIRMIKSDDHI